MTSVPPAISSALTSAQKAQDELVKSSRRLDDAVANCNRHGLPPIAISPAQGQFLSTLCQLAGAKSVLELGTLGGYSTIWLAGSAPDVHVTSIEFNSKHRDVALENLKGMGNVDVVLGSASEILPELASEGRVFDAVIIDANWDGQREYFEWAVKLTRSKGFIYVDNVLRQLTESESEGDPNATALIDSVKNDTRVDATLIPTLNTPKTELSEICDGFVLAIVK